MNKTVLEFAMISSVLMGYFISLALLTSSFYKSRANNYLALSLFVMASLTFFEWPNGIMSTLLLQIIINFRLDFLFAASLFTYFQIQAKSKYLKHPWSKWVYMPFLFSVGIELYLYFSDLYRTDLDFLLYYSKELASIVFNVSLIFWGRHMVKRSKTISEDKKRWLLRLNLFIICTIFSWVLCRLEFYVFNSDHTVFLLWLFMMMFLWWVLYYGVFRLQIIAQKDELRKQLSSKNPSSTYKSLKHSKYGDASTVILQLYRLMEEEELYKNPLLSRLDLADRLGTSEGYLSQIINQEINKSVVQFVNDYRIESAKKLLHTRTFDKYSVEAIGLESGFKSKSAFYAVFKSNLSISPGAYRKLPRTS